MPWPDVSRIDKRPFRNRVFVAVTLADPAAFRARQPAWRRLVVQLNRRLVRGDIFIPDTVLPMPPAELVKTMRRLQLAAQRRLFDHFDAIVVHSQYGRSQLVQNAYFEMLRDQAKVENFFAEGIVNNGAK